MHVRRNISKWGFWYLLPALLFGGLIFFLSSISRYPESFPAFWGFDKVVHCAVYYLLGLLLMRMCIHAPWPVMVKYAAILTAATGIVYGISDELHQSFVPGRMSSVADVVFDALGVILAVISCRVFKGKCDSGSEAVRGGKVIR